METQRHCPPWLKDNTASSKAGHRKTKSLWSWIPVRAFAKIRQQQFYCVFSIFVQTIDGLPSYMDGLRLVVQLERKSKRWQTMPSRAFQHIVEFDETLHIETTIFGRKTSMEDHSMKFLPKDYILSVVAIDAEEHFLFNRHRIDLSRLLPVFVEGFWEPEKPMSSTASFKLGGKAEGAVLVATFDFEVLNEELRRPSLLLDGNASARFRGSSLRRVSRAVKSLPNSPNPSPFERCANQHFTSPCSSDADSTDSLCIRKFDLDSSAKETEEWSVYYYSSSDEERFQALRNDPLSLDAFTETETVTASPAIKVKKPPASLDDFSTQIHLANVDCLEKVEISLADSKEMDTSNNQIDVRTLLNDHGTERNESKKIHGNKEMLGVLAAIPHDAEVASDKFCINIEFVNRSPYVPIKVNQNVVRAPSIEEQRDMVLPPSCVNIKTYDSDDDVFVPERVELFSEAEVTENDLLVERLQPFSFEEVECKPFGICIRDQANADTGVQVAHSLEDVGHESDSETLSDILLGGSDPSASSPRNRSEANMYFQAQSDGKTSVTHVEEDVGYENGVESFVRVTVDELDLPVFLSRHEIVVCTDVQASFVGKVPVAHPWEDVGHEIGLEDSSDVLIELECLSSSRRNEANSDIQAESDGRVPVVHSLEDDGLENFSGLSSQGLDLPACSPRGEIPTDLFHFGAEDEISPEASAVVEGFFDLLEREDENPCLGPKSSVMVEMEVDDSLMIFLEKCSITSAERIESFVFESHEPGKLCPTIGTLQGGEITCGKAAGSFTSEDDLGLFPMIEAAELEMRKAAQSLQSKERAKMVEDAETKALMKEWGLSDKVFERPLQRSLLCSSFELSHSPYSTTVTMLRDGSCLKAVSAHNAWGTLMMQVSKPVVIPASASLCALDVLSSMASRGLQDMTKQAFIKMPLEDLEGSLTGLTSTGVGPTNCDPSSWQRSFERLNVKESPKLPSSSTRNVLGYKPYKMETFSERLVAFEDLTHVALDVIEPLSLEGLKLQCNLWKKAPGSTSLKSLAMQFDMNNQVAEGSSQEESLVKVGRPVELGDMKSPWDMAISLDEWLHLFGHVKASEGELPIACEALQKRGSGKVDQIPKWGTTHSNTFTVVMRLQLRDCQRYYEAVGASMLALVQVERLKETCGGAMDSPLRTRSGVQLRLTAAHIAGVEDRGSQFWGTKKQFQAGYRWLMATLKTGNLRQHVMSQAMLIPPEAEEKHVQGELLWSISSCGGALGRMTWREQEDNFCLCIRNPDIIFAANESE